MENLLIKNIVNNIPIEKPLTDDEKNVKYYFF